MTECKRIFSSKAIVGLFVFLVALNVFLFVYQNRETGYDMGEYRAIYREELERYQSMTPEAALADLAAREEKPPNGMPSLPTRVRQIPGFWICFGSSAPNPSARTLKSGWRRAP